MLKKCITTYLTIVWISSICLVTYQYFQPKAALAYESESVVRVANVDPTLNPTNTSTSAVEEIDSSDVSEVAEISDEPTISYYYFCTPDDADCIYINDYVLKPLAEELPEKEISSLEYYDISDVLEEYTPGRLLNQWGFDSYPAFVSISTNPDNSTEIISSLQWNAENPITSERLKIWLIENDIWTGKVEETGELIEEPNF